jgi:hypothetical protein
VRDELRELLGDLVVASVELVAHRPTGFLAWYAHAERWLRLVAWRSAA